MFSIIFNYGYMPCWGPNLLAGALPGKGKNPAASPYDEERWSWDRVGVTAVHTDPECQVCFLPAERNGDFWIGRHGLKIPLRPIIYLADDTVI